MTPAEIKNSPYFVAGLDLTTDHQVSIWLLDLGNSNPASRTYMQLRFFVDGKEVYQTDEFSPAPSSSTDSLYAVLDGLQWMLVRPGDTDDEFFNSHQQEHLDWLKTIHVDDLTMKIEDVLDDEREEHEQELEYFNNHFTNWRTR